MRTFTKPICLLLLIFSVLPLLHATEDYKDLLVSVAQEKFENADKVNAALAAMETVRQAGAYIESISELFGDGVVTLPVGIQKGEYALIIRELIYNEERDRNQLFASCAFKFKEDGQAIAFEGYVDVEGQNGMGTSGDLELITPVSRKMGSELSLVFRKGTRVNFGCDGIESFFGDMVLVLNSEKIKPLDFRGKPTGGALGAAITGHFEDFDSFSIGFDFNQSFAFEGLDDFVFTIRGATLDQSDVFTPATAHFPQGYGLEGDAQARNLWKGIAVTNASVSLPGFFNKPGVEPEEGEAPSLDKRLSLAMKNVIIDNNGFSGVVSAETEVFSSELLDKDRWDLSLSEFALEFFKGDIAGLDFAGDINIPPFGDKSLLPYRASFNHSTNNYEFAVGITGEFDLPVLGATLDLNRNSYIEIAIEDGGIYPSINACGILSINANLGKGDNPKKLKIPDIPFENMRISRAAPYFEIGTVALTGDLQSPELAGFELHIGDIAPFTSDNGGGLRFDAGVKLSEVFGGEAGVQLYGDYSKWKFDRVGVDKIAVDFSSGAYSVFGAVEFKNGDEVYGSGFRGDVKFTLLNRFTLDAVAVFGKKDDYRYFLTDVFYETPPSSGIIIAPVPISFYGFGGGLYRRMQQSYNPNINSDFGKSLSGINYIPDKSVGMGFMTSTKFGMAGVPSTFSAKVGFEIQFNSSGGLNFVQLRGDATFMDSPDKWGKLAANINEKVKKLEESGGKLQRAARSDLKVPENKEGGFLTASMLMEYDAANKVFAADLSTYLNAGFIKGIGENDRMGWASVKFSDDEWYAYLGTPSDRLGVEILGLARTDGYFMIGDNIPELPAPPEKVLKNFSKAKQDKINKRSSYDMAQGSGIAFGQSLQVGFKATLPPFYAGFGVGMGAEFLLKNYGAEAYCAGSEPPLGINGWYARAQAWAYVEADIGIEAKVFGSRKKFSILDISASTLLEGAGPNPFYFSGAVGGRFSVMGGLVSGRCDFDFEIGDECKVMAGSPFGEEVIAQLTPSTGEADVNVFVAPQAVFNIPVGLEMEVEEDDNKKAWYRVTLEEFKCYYKESGEEISGAQQFTEEGRVLVLDPDEALKSRQDLMVRAKVGFERRVSGDWKKVLGYDGKPVIEEKEATFKSGDRPKQILPEHVKYSYPVDRQYNYYPNEYDKGYLLVSKNYDYLFTTDIPEGYTQELRLTDSYGAEQNTSFSFTTRAAGNDIRLEIDFSSSGFKFKNDEIYSLAILNVPTALAGLSDNIATATTRMADGDSLFVEKKYAEGSLDLLEEDRIYTLHFRTSSYNTFAQKMENVQGSSGRLWQLEPHVYEINTGVQDFSSSVEMFDLSEINMADADDNLIRIVPVYNATPWYVNQVKPLIYGNADVLKATDMVGLMPKENSDVVTVGSASKFNMLTDELLKSNSRTSVSKFAAFTNNASYHINNDYKSLRTILANTVVATNLRTDKVASFLATNHIPDLTPGEYGLELRYVLPGKNKVSSKVERIIIVQP